MPSSSEHREDNVPRRPNDRDRQPPSGRRDEPRDFETQVSDSDRNYDAPFDADLEPLEDEPINTHGSER